MQMSKYTDQKKTRPMLFRIWERRVKVCLKYLLTEAGLGWIQLLVLEERNEIVRGRQIMAIETTTTNLSERTLKRCSLRLKALVSSSRVMSPDWSTSVSWKRVAVNSANVSSKSSDGDWSRKQRRINFISRKSIAPSAESEEDQVVRFVSHSSPTITIEDLEEKLHFLAVISFDDEFQTFDERLIMQQTGSIHVQIIE